MRFRLATWNINSVRLRIDLVARFVQAYRPDILCLQEIKCVEEAFPEAPVRALVFSHVAISGQKGYHGVATLSRIPFRLIEARDICGRGHARHISVALDLAVTGKSPLIVHNIYVPAGGDLPDPVLNDKFRHKLDFLEAMAAWFGGMRGKRRNRMVMVGDLNVAPLPTDVWSHKQLLKVVSHTPPGLPVWRQAHLLLALRLTAFGSRRGLCLRLGDALLGLLLGLLFGLLLRFLGLGRGCGHRDPRDLNQLNR